MDNENIKSGCYDVECKGQIVESSTLSQCDNKPEIKIGFAKIPAIIAEFTVQIDVESRVKLAEPALEIKRIKKNVFLTQCRVVGKTSKVFLKGFVRKNIEYATVDSVSKSAICGDIKHTTVYVPFQCITELKHMRCVEDEYNPNIEEITYFDEKNLGRDMDETDLISGEVFNEKVYCELESARIYEADIVEECRRVDHHPVEVLFDAFIEKEVICLTMKLLQNKQIGKMKHMSDEVEC